MTTPPTPPEHGWDADELARMDLTWSMLPTLLTLSSPPPRTAAAQAPLVALLHTIAARQGSTALAVTLYAVLGICVEAGLPDLAVQPGDPLHHDLTNLGLAYVRADDPAGLHVMVSALLEHHPDVLDALMINALCHAWRVAPQQCHGLIRELPTLGPPSLLARCYPLRRKGYSPPPTLPEATRHD